MYSSPRLKFTLEPRITGLPVTGQIRTMQTGLQPEILPFGEVVLNQLIKLQRLVVPTTFEFPSPVYLETVNLIVRSSVSNEYKVFISRMGEEDVTS